MTTTPDPLKGVLSAALLSHDQVRAVILMVHMRYPDTPEGELAARLIAGELVQLEHVQQLVAFLNEREC